MRNSNNLKKCMKYDLWALFRYWWPVAVGLPVAAIPLGFISSLFFENAINDDGSGLLFIMSYIAVMLSYAMLVGFGLYTGVLVIIRYYKNFYTDEGYLTFTLPVEREVLFRSKLLSALVFELAFAFSATLSVFLFFLMTGTSVNPITAVFGLIGEYFSFFTVSLALEIFILIAVTSIISILLIYTCITLGGIIIKKHKILGAIIVYYIGNGVILPVVSTVGIIGATVIIGFASTAFEGMGEIRSKAVVLIIGLAVNAILAAFAGFLYNFMSRNIERRLNLD